MPEQSCHFLYYSCPGEPELLFLCTDVRRCMDLITACPNTAVCLWRRLMSPLSTLHANLCLPPFGAEGEKTPSRPLRTGCLCFFHRLHAPMANSGTQQGLEEQPVTGDMSCNKKRKKATNINQVNDTFRYQAPIGR